MGTDKVQPLTLICNFPNAKLYFMEVEITGLQLLDVSIGLDWALLIYLPQINEVMGCSILKNTDSVRKIPHIRRADENT
jgi:hypothetical protein